MWRAIRACVSAMAMAAAFVTSAAAADDVDLLLVMAADVSRSVDAAKFQLQRNGYAAALSNPRVLKSYPVRSARAQLASLSSNGPVWARKS